MTGRAVTRAYRASCLAMSPIEAHLMLDDQPIIKNLLVSTVPICFEPCRGHPLTNAFTFLVLVAGRRFRGRRLRWCS